MPLSHEDIVRLCSETDNVLWDAFNRSTTSVCHQANVGHLIFPQYYNGTQVGSLRISEQEARFAFVESLCNSSFQYSVESPTSRLYSFTGSRPLSARSDLTIYENTRQRVCNVEFKAKGVSPAAENHLSIQKDLQKLLREPVWGLWFHLLKAINNKTINNLLSVIHLEIDRIQHDHIGVINSPGLSIHICVLTHEFSVHRDLTIPSNHPGFDIALLRRQLSLELSVSRTRLVSVDNSNGWNLHNYR